MARLSEQAARVKEVLLARDGYATTREWLDRVLSLLPAGAGLEQDTLGWLEQELIGGYGWEYTKVLEEYDEHTRFWRTMAERFPERPKLRGTLADTLLRAGRRDEALDQFVEAFRQEPTLVYEFGGELYDFMKEKGGEHWLEYRLTLVRAALASDNEEYAKEVYRRLLDEYRDDQPALKKIHALAFGKRDAG